MDLTYNFGFILQTKVYSLILRRYRKYSGVVVSFWNMICKINRMVGNSDAWQIDDCLFNYQRVMLLETLDLAIPGVILHFYPVIKIKMFILLDFKMRMKFTPSFEMPVQTFFPIFYP